MQQLDHFMFVSTDKQRNILQSSKDIYIEGFNHWAATFCQQYDLRKRDIAIGADRAQLTFQLDRYDFLLCYEALSESLWIEGQNALANQNIQLLAQLLSKDPLVQIEHM